MRTRMMLIAVLATGLSVPSGVTTVEEGTTHDVAKQRINRPVEIAKQRINSGQEIAKQRINIAPKGTQEIAKQRINVAGNKG